MKEQFTRVMASNRNEWLENRKKGIGGSDCSVILGMNRFKTNVCLWEEKTGIREPKKIDTDKTKYGHNAEESIRQLFMLDYPEYELFHDEFMTLQNKEYDFLLASLDGELTDKETGQKGILEIKTTEIMNKQMLEEWNRQIPNNYYMQCLHYLLVTGYEFVWLRAKIKFSWDKNKQEIRDYYFTREEVIEDINFLKEKEIYFWKENVEKKKRPGLILPGI